MSSDNQLGRDIAAAREAAGLTQLALANAIGVDPQTISRWERGERTPGPNDLYRIGEETGRTYDPPRIIPRRKRKKS